MLSTGCYYFHCVFQNGKTALHFAAHKGQLLAVRALIEAGADLDITDEVWGTFKEGDIGGYLILPYGKKNRTYQNTAPKIDEILIPHNFLDSFIIANAYLKLHPPDVFIYLDLYSLHIDLYSLVCFVLHSVLTCMRQESAKWYCNTVKDLFLPNTVYQKQHTAGLGDTTILHVKIVNVLLFK